MPRIRLEIDDTHRCLLTAWIRAGTTPQRVVRRARIVLLVGQGLSTRAIAQRMNVATQTVALWRRRFQDHGPDVLWRDAPGRGRKPSLGGEVASRLRELLGSPPPAGDRWTIRHSRARPGSVARPCIASCASWIRLSIGDRGRGPVAVDGGARRFRRTICVAQF